MRYKRLLRHAAWLLAACSLGAQLTLPGTAIPVSSDVGLSGTRYEQPTFFEGNDPDGTYEHVLKYDANGGKWSDSSKTATDTRMTVACTATAFTVKEAPTRKKWTFREWNESLNAHGPAYQPGDTVSVLESKILYAIWEATLTYEVGLTSRTVSGMPDPATAVDDGRDTANFIVSSAVPTIQGGTFTGWATEPMGEVVYYPGDVVTSEGHITLYAVWDVATYRINRVIDGEIEDYVDLTVPEYPTVDLSVCAGEDYLYGGLFTDNTFTELIDDGINGASVTPSDGDEFFIRLVPDRYLSPATFLLYNGGAYTELFLCANFDSYTAYREIGYDMTVNGQTRTIANTGSYFLLNFELGQDSDLEIDATDFGYGADDYFNCVRMQDAWIASDNVTAVITPYYVTMDGVKVTSAIYREITFTKSTKTVGNCTDDWTDDGTLTSSVVCETTLYPFGQTCFSQKGGD